MKKTLILIALLLAFSPIAHAEDTADTTETAEPVSFIGSWGAPDDPAGDDAAAANAGHPFKGDRFSLEMAKEYDTDGDGTLSDTEKEAMKAAIKTEMEAKKAEMLAKYDADGDGSLSDTEKTAMREAMKAEMDAKLLEKFDADGDGTLSDTEKATMEKSRPRRGGGRRGGPCGENGPGMGNDSNAQVPEELLTKYDTDSDGSLSDTEKAAMQTALKAEREAKKAEMLTKYDADGDGSLSDTEKTAMREAMKAEMDAKLLEKFDADGDGTLSDAEKATMEKSRPQRGGGHRRGPGGEGEPGMDGDNDRPIPEELLTKYDTDGDGSLSDTEKTAMQTAMQTERETRKAEMLTKYDADGDGTLSDSERQTMDAARKTEMESKMLEKFDADGDGTLSDSEKSTMESSRPQMGEGRGPGGKGGPRGQRPGLKNRR